MGIIAKRLWGCRRNGHAGTQGGLKGFGTHFPGLRIRSRLLQDLRDRAEWCTMNFGDEAGLKARKVFRACSESFTHLLCLLTRTRNSEQQRLHPLLPGLQPPHLRSLQYLLRVGLRNITHEKADLHPDVRPLGHEFGIGGKL